MFYTFPVLLYFVNLLCSRSPPAEEHPIHTPILDRTGRNWRGSGMDGVTHAALGALVGEWLLGRKLGNRALALGAAVGLLPELDVLMVPFVDQARWLDWRDSVTHSLLMLALVSVFLGRWLAGRMAKPKLSASELGWPVSENLRAILVGAGGVRCAVGL
jgi:hypothetical protein